MTSPLLVVVRVRLGLSYPELFDLPDALFEEHADDLVAELVHVFPGTELAHRDLLQSRVGESSNGLVPAVADSDADPTMVVDALFVLAVADEVEASHDSVLVDESQVVPDISDVFGYFVFEESAFLSEGAVHLVGDLFLLYRFVQPLDVFGLSID